MQTQARFALGQRYIAAGAGEGFYSVDQVPGNALGAYLDGATVEVFCNAQDATGDTMNGGEIIVHGSSGDATGYAMRGGSIYIERDAGYRCGIHMKEYQAGGTIVVLGIGWEDRCPVGNFCGTGMHGGRIYLRTTHLPPDLPAQVVVSQATEEDISHLRPLVEEYCRRFQVEKEPLLASHYYVLRPNTKNPYKQLYVNN